MADFESMQTAFTDEEFDLRSKEMHEYHLQQLHNNPELYNHYFTSILLLGEASSWKLRILT